MKRKKVGEEAESESKLAYQDFMETTSSHLLFQPKERGGPIS